MIPRLAAADSSLGFLRDGYLFGSRRFEPCAADAFRTRLGGLPVVVMRGSHAARFFYEGGRFTRAGAIPPSVTHLLQDKKSVQTLEGRAHAMRKALFVDALTGPQALDGMVPAFQEEWMREVARWEGLPTVSLSAEVPLILGRAIFRWAGISATPSELDRRSSELQVMIDNAASIGPKNWLARSRRLSTEAWARAEILEARLSPDRSDATALHRIAHARDEAGEFLPPAVAAVELINVLRPFVAISRFILFAVLGLRRRPDLAAAFREGDEGLLENFAHEVRRFYPFFPVIAGRATSQHYWAGHRFARGSLVILDIFGTNRDPSSWGDPDTFRPERFADHDINPNHLIAQGGGTYLDDHRCPGEPATVAVICAAVRLLTQTMTFDLPEQDLRINLRRMPAMPESGVVICNVRSSLGSLAEMDDQRRSRR